MLDKLLNKMGLRETPEPDGIGADLSDLTPEEREEEMKNAPKVDVDDPTDEDDD